MNFHKNLPSVFNKCSIISLQKRMKKKLVHNMFVSSAYYFLYESCMISGAAYYDDNCLITLNNIGATCEDRF